LGQQQPDLVAVARHRGVVQQHVRDHTRQPRYPSTSGGSPTRPRAPRAPTRATRRPARDGGQSRWSGVSRRPGMNTQVLGRSSSVVIESGWGAPRERGFLMLGACAAR
jgi:hypothetical protein